MTKPVSKTPEDAPELALQSLEAMRGMPLVMFPLTYDNFGELFVLDTKATLAMKEDSFKTFCITFYNAHYPGWKERKGKEEASAAASEPRRVHMFVHVGLIDIKGRTVVRDVGVFTDCGGSSLSYEAVVAPTKRFSRSELKNEVFFHDAEADRWRLRSGGRIVDAVPEDRVAAEIVDHAKLALKKSNRQGASLVAVFLDATLVGHFDELLRRSKKEEAFYAVCGSWLNLQAMALSSCSRKKVVFGAFEYNARLLPRLFFHHFHCPVPDYLSPASVMYRIHVRVSLRDDSATARANQFLVPKTQEMSVCAMHCCVDEETGCLLSVECSIRDEATAGGFQDYKLPISPYGALADRTSEGAEGLELRKALRALLKKIEGAASGRPCVLISLHPGAILPRLLLALVQCDLEERFCNAVTCVADLRLGMAHAVPSEADDLKKLSLKDSVDNCRVSWNEINPNVSQLQ